MNSSNNKALNFVALNKMGNEIKVKVKFSSRAKYTKIKVMSSGAELIVPSYDMNIFYDKAYQFLLSKELWIRQKLEELVHHASVDQNNIPLFGQMMTLIKLNSLNNRVEIRDDNIYVESKSISHYTTLKNFLRDILFSEIERVSSIMSKQSGLNYNTIKIINSKNKWGSCSRQKVISFNWRLVFAPKEILEYVVVHEICHTLEMNHSKSFWNLVAKFYPEYKQARQWLKKNNSRLHQYLQL